MQILKFLSLQLAFRQWLSRHKYDIVNILTLVILAYDGRPRILLAISL